MKEIEKLEKLIKLLGHRGKILSGSQAHAFCPKDKQKDYHTINFKDGKFIYWSAQESHHDGDYYDETTLELEATQKLISACIEKLRDEAIGRTIAELELKESVKLRRKAEALLNRRLK